MLERDDFEKTKMEAEELYKTFGEVYCPYFKEKVVFNSRGLEHLKFKKREIARSERDQYVRFKLLYLAPVIISLSNVVQGIRTEKSFEETSINNRNGFFLKEIIYYEFIGLIKKERVKIIIKQVENGPKVFWSIIPFWKTDRKSSKRILYSGAGDD